MSDEDLTDAFEVAKANLFAGSKGQMELFDDAALFFLEKQDPESMELGPSPRNPTYTAQQFKRLDPKGYNLAVWMRLQMLGLRYTAATVGVSTNTIAAIDRELDRCREVETVRSALARNSRSMANLTLERIQGLLMNRSDDDLTINELGNLYRHLVEKSELLEGNATARVDWKPEQRDRNDYLEYIQDAELVQPDPQGTGSGAEKSGPIGGMAALPGPLTAAPPPVPGPAQDVVEVEESRDA